MFACLLQYFVTNEQQCPVYSTTADEGAVQVWSLAGKDLQEGRMASHSWIRNITLHCSSYTSTLIHLRLLILIITMHNTPTLG